MKKLFLVFLPITILSAISLLVIIFTFDPFESDGMVKFLFLASLAAFLWGCGGMVFFILNVFSDDRPADALRRGFFFALFVVFMLFLYKREILSWYAGFSGATIITLMELLIYRKSKVVVSNPEDFT